MIYLFIIVFSISSSIPCDDCCCSSCQDGRTTNNKTIPHLNNKNTKLQRVDNSTVINEVYVNEDVICYKVPR